MNCCVVARRCHMHARDRHFCDNRCKFTVFDFPCNVVGHACVELPRLVTYNLMSKINKRLRVSMFILHDEYRFRCCLMGRAGPRI